MTLSDRRRVSFCCDAQHTPQLTMCAPPPQTQTPHTVVSRQDAQVPPWYAPQSQAFIQLDDEFVAHATKLAPCKRLPTGWETNDQAEEHHRVHGEHRLGVRATEHGWLVERYQGAVGQVLAHVLCDFPVLCDTDTSAARLAEAARRGLPPEYLLNWISRH
jgi:hypothetical protein